MPTYKVTIPGSGTYEVESERPMSDAEAYQAALASAAPRSATEQLVRGAGGIRSANADMSSVKG